MNLKTLVLLPVLSISVIACTANKAYTDGPTGPLKLSNALEYNYSYQAAPTYYSNYYDKGFPGASSIAWQNPKFQRIVSRMGAAKTCNIPFNQAQAQSNFNRASGLQAFVPELDGIAFHNEQSKSIPNFCTPKHVSEIKKFMPLIEAGRFDAL